MKFPGNKITIFTLIYTILGCSVQIIAFSSGVTNFLVIIDNSRPDCYGTLGRCRIAKVAVSRDLGHLKTI